MPLACSVTLPVILVWRHSGSALVSVGSSGVARRYAVVTINTWGTCGNWPQRPGQLHSGFRGLGADVLTLQETILTDRVDQASEMIGTDYRLVQQRHRESDGQGITTASRWPVGRVLEIDLRVTERTGDFACTCLATEVLAPDPLGRIWVANHFPDYQLDHERERVLQTVTVARRLEPLVQESPGHVIVAGGLDGDPTSDSLRFWTGRHVIADSSVCYRSAWEAVHPDEPLATYVPRKPAPGRPRLAVPRYRSCPGPLRTGGTDPGDHGLPKDLRPGIGDAK